MSDIVMDASVVLGVVSIALAMVLFAFYRRLYAQTQSGFGLALLIFAAAFVVQSALTVYSYLNSMPLIPDSFAPFLFAIGLCEATGLGAVVWTASR
jgi:RsiW-degrading membrane proteinase PrsW (M82 family)